MNVARWAVWVLVAGIGISSAGADEPAAVLIYSNDFQEEVGTEWSKTTTKTTPKGEHKILGQFAREVITFKKEDLPKHRFLRINFALYIVHPWDGSSPYWGVDPFDVSIENGPTLMHTSFCNCGFFSDNNRQAFPDEFPDKYHPGWTGASEKQTLGYIHSWGGPDRTFDTSGIYNLSFSFPHTDDSLSLVFTSHCKSGKAWGIDDFKVEALDQGTPLDKDALEKSWTALDGEDGLAAFQAKWALIASAETAGPFLSERMLGPAPDKETFLKLAKGLKSEDKGEHDAARKELLEVGEPFRKLIENQINEDSSPYMKVEWIRLLEEFKTRQEAAPHRLQKLRAAHALEVIESRPNRARQNALKLPPKEAAENPRKSAR